MSLNSIPAIARLRRARTARELGCTAGRTCRGRDSRHGPCMHCGELTCARSHFIESGTLRRRWKMCCIDCSMINERAHGVRARARSQRDWERLTDPIDPSRLEVGQLPEQFPGPTRATLRAFVDSGAQEAVVRLIPPGILNQSIRTLGLTEMVYAEQRGNKTVLRRVDLAAP